MNKIVEIDPNSGFCFGVVNAIEKAESELNCRGVLHTPSERHTPVLYCLGDIVHNSQEVDRLKKKGLQTINHAGLQAMRGKKVLLRAHGEPPSTYEIARQNDIQIIDATCPVVLQLQKKIREKYQTTDSKRSQIVIFGKSGHAEVNGLVGQTEGKAIVIEHKADIEQLDFTKDIYLFSQTTMSVDDFEAIVAEIQSRIQPSVSFNYSDTICRKVANRMQSIQQFASKHDLVLFVAGEKSSNGKVLLSECLKANPNTHLISNASEINSEWLKSPASIGICGATSTPKWLMEAVADKCNQL
ncbi:MAG: 4-hydroxy-3-methylbut-2-enyl diphosphate reductase [Candidatus Symbiothrix sp.]|jgi:4-hydroxy-3-methylbut-2-enyl diphosphate reductase|nr:4-hydroxy-3-methylbut-2-enyl diphosphate reductase [Candidatus Symbiothrix sp.]